MSELRTQVRHACKYLLTDYEPTHLPRVCVEVTLGEGRAAPANLAVNSSKQW